MRISLIHILSRLIRKGGYSFWIPETVEFNVFLQKERDIFYIDLYDQNVTFITRFTMPNQIAVPKENESIRQIHIDDDNNLYCLIFSNENPAQLRKYRLIF